MSASAIKIKDEDVYDVIIVGAGISGSYAAYLLKKRCKNIRILIIEGKDRVGGRTCSINLKCSKENQKSRWDIGGQWVGDLQTNVMRVLSELNLETFKQFEDGNKMLETNGEISWYDSSVPCSSWLSWIDMQLYNWRVNRYLARISTLDPYAADSRLAAELESVNFKEFLLSKMFTPTVRSTVISNTRTVFAMELDQINTLFGLMFIKAAGGTVESVMYAEEGCAQGKKVKGGTQQISQKCLDFVLSSSDQDKNSAKLMLNTAMLHVTQVDGEVEVLTQQTATGERRTFRAKKVISSIPINQYTNVSFTPELPYYKFNFFKFVQMGNYMKFIVTYKTPFWRNSGKSGESTYDGSVRWLTQEKFEEAYRSEMKSPGFNRKLPKYGAVCESFDGSNEDDEPALVGFIASEVAVEWGDMSEELRRTEVIEDLVRLFGPEARNYVDYVDKNWAYEPFSGGCPCLNVVGSGVMKDFARATREPFFNFHFAGTETSTKWQGYMDGAIESGERAANEVLFGLYGLEAGVRVDYEKTYYSQKEEIEKLKRADAKRIRMANVVGAVSGLAVKLSIIATALAVGYFKLKQIYDF